MNFELENAIKDWKKNLFKNSTLEPGNIEELENHLRDSIEIHVENGESEQSAFEKATSTFEYGFDEAVEEFKYTSATHESRSKWLSSWWIPELLPNVLKVTFRNFKRQPGYSFINITGLAIGMACCFVIFMYVSNELSYDKFHEKAERIYRVDQTNMWANFEGKFGSTGPGVAGVLKAELPEIETVLRVNNPADWLVTIQSNTSELRYFEEPRVLAADSTFFTVFTMEFLEGNPTKSLNAPFSVVITEQTRLRYFDGESALGKALTVGNPGEEMSYQITGVVKDMPDNSHFTFDLLASLSSNPTVKRREDTWIWTTFVTYVVLDENASVQNLRQKLPEILEPYAEAKLYNSFGMSAEEFKSSQKNWELFLTPITDIHLRATDSGNRIGTVSDIFYVSVFSTIALLIIGLASINFMNLSSARSVHRAKEVGIRKTLGSYRSNLIGQFLMESVLFSFISLFFALITLFFMISPFNAIAATKLSLSQLFTPIHILGILGFTVFIGLLAGMYPALYLTSFTPIQAFKNKVSAISGNKLSFAGLRNFLVVFQFAISIMLISCSIIIYQQLHFLQSKNLGFEKENMFVLKNVEKLGDQAKTFKQLLERESGVAQVAHSNAVPPEIWYEDFATVYGANGTEIPLNSMVVDDDHISTMGFEMIQGKAFEKETAANAHYVVLNETAVHQFQWEDKAKESENFPIGERILFSGDGVQYEVIGVVKNFNITSLHYDILPLGIFHESSILWKGPNQFLTVKLAPTTDLSSFIEKVNTHWNALAGNLPFDYTFLDDQLFSQYEVEQRIANVVSIFTGLAIFIAILGLLGLISFSIERKTKEIGVRKVVGASSQSIVFLLSKEMSRLIVISIFISIPAAWYLMNNWLEEFVYKTEINALVFILSGVIALVLALTALSYQTIKAAMQNPVKSLKSE